MKRSIPAILLAVLLASGCTQTKLTQFDHGDIHLRIGGRVTRGQGFAMADLKPGVYYCPDEAAKQVLIEAKLVEIGRRDIEILGIDWFDGTGPLIAAGDIVNTTPKDPPMAVGGLANIGIGGGIGRGRGRTGCPHGPGCRNCGGDHGGGVGGGINVPVITGRGAKEKPNVTSVNATFDLGAAVDINQSYLAITIKLGLDADGKLIVQPMLIPVIEAPKEDPPTPPVRKPATTVRIHDDQTITIGGLLEESEEEVKEKVPILSDIPMLGRLFKNKAADSTKRNLIIFVTPRIILQNEE